MSNIVKHEQSSFQIQTLDEAMRFSEAIAQAGIVPDSFKRQPANILVAQEISKALGESVWVTMSEMSIISGRPSFSAKFMRSRVRQAGHRLRESFDKETGVARAVIIRSDDPEFEHSAEWDKAKAEQHQLWGKGHWKKNPELMLKNRALSEVVREACYEVMGGVAYTPDEVQDFAPVRNEAQRMDQEPQQRQDAQPSKQSEVDQEEQQRQYEEWEKAQMDKLMASEASGDLEGVERVRGWFSQNNHQRLAQMSGQIVERMKATQEASPTAGDAVDNAQQVLDAEVVNA